MLKDLKSDMSIVRAWSGIIGLEGLSRDYDSIISSL